MIRELSYQNSRKYIQYFESLEKPSPLSMDWVDVDDSNATYIWWLEIESGIEKPLGFLSYKVLILPNKIDFIYIVKIYVLKSHRGENPTLVEDERVSEILFRQIDRKGVNILTLESACEELDVYYKSLGFEYNEEISQVFAKEIGTIEQIMYRRKEVISDNIPDEVKDLFSLE